MSSLAIRRALPDDAPGIVDVLAVVAAERIHSAIDRVWSVDAERHFLAGLTPREAVHVAVSGDEAIVGLQILDRWSPLESMSHVGQLGTFVLPAWRRQGTGSALWSASRTFATAAGYRKLVIQVRATNLNAQAYYRRLGFGAVGLLSRQVSIDGVDDDEVLMELFLRRHVPGG